ncbi:MAG: 1-phosphofructokinase [Oscillospiraceae bacterium]
MIYTLTCNPALDCLMDLDVLTAGAVNRAAAQQLTCGGKGVNVALVLSQLEQSVTALGFLAGNTGLMLQNELTRLRLRTDFITLPQGDTRINVKLVTNCETQINGPGPTVDDTALQALTHKLTRLTAGDTLVLAGSLPPPLPDCFYRDLMTDLTRRNVDCVVDAEGDLLRLALESRPFLIKPNLDELSELVGEQLAPTDRDGVLAACRRAQKLGATQVLLSLGGTGALLVTPEEDFFIPAPEGAVCCSVGAGDALLAGFLAGLNRYGAPYPALALAVAAGSATAFSDGLASADEINRLCETIFCATPPLRTFLNFKPHSAN